MSDKEPSQSQVDLICRQTTYTQEEATQKLLLHNNNIQSVIKEYLGVTSKQSSTKSNSSVNQQIYKELRGFMDTIQDEYEKRKEAEE